MKNFPGFRSTLPFLSGLALSVALVGCGSSDENKPKNISNPTPETNPLEVTTNLGPYIGIKEDNLIAFKGVRYAAAPEGELRFEAPVAPEAFEDAKTADTFGSACPQAGGSFGPPSLNEDCLFLNVYRPLKGKDHPVMVWIHGGAFISGSGAGDYNPVRLVEEDVVVVTLNYRLGALGFLAHPSLNEGDSGNYGLMDQQFALKWVQDNIESFGGDKDNVTIFGESAGGHSVMNHLSTQSSAGLFHKAIVQSGTYHLEDVPLATSKALGSALVSQTSCAEVDDVEACLKTLPVEDMLAAQGDDQFIPTYGNSFSSVSPLQAILGDTFSDVPLINGNNLNEATLFTTLNQINNFSTSIEAAAAEAAAEAYQTEFLASGDQVAAAAAADAAAAAAAQDPAVLQAAGLAAYNTVNLDNYEAVVDALISPFFYTQNGRTTEQIADDYLGDSVDVYAAYNRLHTDWRFACTASLTADRLAGGRDIYQYHFTDQNAPNLFAGVGLPSGFATGASHASEIPYVLSDGSGLAEGSQDLSEAMIDYWTTFAKTGNPNPNNSNLVTWPEYTTQGDNMIKLNQTIAPTSRTAFNTTHNCDYWNVPNDL